MELELLRSECFHLNGVVEFRLMFGLSLKNRNYGACLVVSGSSQVIHAN